MIPKPPVKLITQEMITVFYQHDEKMKEKVPRWFLYWQVLLLINHKWDRRRLAGFAECVYYKGSKESLFSLRINYMVE